MLRNKISLALLGCIAMISSASADAVHIASEVSYPPWNDTKGGHFEGYEVDLYPLICEKAGVECDFNGQQFSSIIPSVRFKKWDVIMSGMGITPDRLRVIDFTRPYGLMPTVLLTKKGSNLTYCSSCSKKIDLKNRTQEEALGNSIREGFSGKKIGVQKGSLHHTYFNEHKQLAREVELVFAETQGELVDMLEKGQIDSIMTTKTYAVDMINKGRNIQMVGPDISGGMMGNGVGIGLRKEDAELKAKLDKAIEELEKDGTLSKLTSKWFGFDMFAN